MIETNRCFLLKLQADDYEDVKLLYVNGEVRKYLGGPQEEESIKASFKEVNKTTADSLNLIAREKKTNNFIGLVSLDAHHDGISTEVSYQLLPTWWGNGYASEIVKELINYGFNNLNLTEVIAETQIANKASCGLLQKLGMSLRNTVERFGEKQAIYGIEK
ncbi:GNAT family N-acetyltransferase [Alkalihalobacillus macyae]|uniref:GNAT family N-acetyltransferase n=1 Tax=Guptibacillus hwajinpoensis TaxID=208199 RepID=UPI00273BF803|nr:GNAT family N-acetyltransferase [Alkalihalobacillus macyae]MDP4553486.1 GNAT family N-acetyltransferase [Alkalihalobacillus macyae]